MAVLDTMQGFLQKHVGPIAHKVSNFKVVQGLMTGMMSTMPVTLGVALLSILAGLPVAPLQEFLASTGMLGVINDVLVVTMNLGALYMCISVSYSFGNVLGNKGMASVVATVGVVLLLIPLGVTEEGVKYLPTSYLGSSGLFVALIIALAVPAALNFLMKHIAVPLPDSVPQFVSDSLSPMFCAIVIFTGAALLKWGMTLTSYGDVFDFVNSTIATPIMFLGATPGAMVIYFILCNLLFFFGVHPSVLMAVYMPVMQSALLANVEAATAGQPLPYLMYAMMLAVGSVDALGMELALLTGKSERFKALSRIALVPAIFNISEPIMFGTPIAMNPYMFIPYILLKPVACLVAVGGCLLGLGVGLNPTVSMPFVVPLPVSNFFTGGIGMVVVVCAAIVAVGLVFFPFVKVADTQYLKEEAEAAKNAEVAE